LAEFTGERVIPGEVDADLWNEHFARYAFAARLSRRKRVLDAGCGSGYGSAELARSARQVVGVDVSLEAVEYATGHYKAPNTLFLAASCTALPFAAGSFELVVAFEMIEHLLDWRGVLEEARRVLAPAGQCVISTPNKDYYTGSRGASGVNPFHQHEFTFQEFREELRAVFPHVSLFLQNHSEGVVFQPAKSFSPAEARVESGGGNPEDAHFFLAVCALAPQTGAPTFLYMPRAANILRERERHIERLDLEIEARKRSIEDLGSERSKLIEMFQRQKLELEERNRWAEKLDQELAQAGALVRQLQEELEAQARGYEERIAQIHQEMGVQVAGYEQKIAQLHQEMAERAHGYEAKIAELEKTLLERTNWALGLDRRVSELEASLNLLRSSRWVRFGSALGVGPRLRNE
jgi:SAM-dependent methyltransferase